MPFLIINWSKTTGSPPNFHSTQLCTAMLNYYKILEIEYDADEASIKRAYRKLALKCHPDQNPHPGAAEQFIQIHEAYTVLMDARSRIEYNRLLMDKWNKTTSYNTEQTGRYHEKAEQGKQQGDTYIKDYALFKKRLNRRIWSVLIVALFTTLLGAGGLERIFGILLFGGGLAMVVIGLVKWHNEDLRGFLIGGPFMMLGGFAYTRGVLKDIREEMEEEDQQNGR